MVKEVYVRDLFNESKDGWDRERVSKIYGDFMRDQLCNIPIIHNGPNDRRIWFHNPHGVLEIGGLDSKLLNGNYLRCVDWIEEAARVMDIKAVSDFITVLWNDTIKVNFDAAVYGMSAWYGLVARDADGFVHGGHVGFVNKELHTEWAELQAMEESIYFARSKNWNSVKLESDCASLVNRFNCRQEDLTMLGHRLREIQKLTNYFSHFSFNWALRCCNKVADALCSWAKTNNYKMDFNMDCPLEIHELVLSDAIN
ncbi:hypothetical protein Gohar_028334 [Gossypium harknessii]|uniref:RNase H type-1 domain-containing protein n=1 Tax=Gossypium harknessii TaxID=34285 RepID=A0A7J9I8V1_9ROSI|nr:hypothetical protein [Gossypium harknessii]